MRKCKWCGTSGWLLKISGEGLCQKCEADVKMRVHQVTRVLNENLNLMRRARELDTRLAKGHDAIRQLQELIPYYQGGLVKLQPSPQELVARIYMTQRKITNQHIDQLFKAALMQAQKAPTDVAKGQYLTEVVETIEKYKAELGKTNEIRWRKRLEQDREKLLVQGNKQKDQGKTRRAKAINQYIEALDMLRADDNGDPENKHRIEQIKKRIRDLGGKLPAHWSEKARDEIAREEKARDEKVQDEKVRDDTVQSGGDGLPAN